ncbi:MAG: hypothetical protein ABIH89_04930 [Elusimicrobiota bacterium]
MSIIDFSIGVFVMLMGFGFLYRPNKVQQVNRWIRDNIFNDRLLLIHRRRVGVMLIFLGAAVIYFALK